MSKALVVLSGGQDSTTCLFLARTEYEEVHAITFDYGQRHDIEIESASRVAEMASVASHTIIDVPAILRSSSPLTSDAPLEQYQDATQMASVIGDRVELTFVPMRNALFLTVAVNHALALGCQAVITGICQEDNANYPDCTEGFRVRFQEMVNAALGSCPVEIRAPLIRYDKKKTVLLARWLGYECWDALAYTHTSYDGNYPPTDMNHANVLRAKGFEDANLPDPLVLRAHKEGLMPLPATANYDRSRGRA